jgi:hypothetical protein
VPKGAGRVVAAADKVRDAASGRGGWAAHGAKKRNR